MGRKEKSAEDDIELQIKLRERCRQLRLWEILCRQSDREHPITKKDLVTRMAEEGFKVNDHTLKDDIRALNLLGDHGVQEHLANHVRTYYAINPQFAPTELRVIVDALQANSTLTQKERDALLANLFSHNSISVQDSIVEGRKMPVSRSIVNDTLQARLDVLEKACRKERQVTFQYFYLDEALNHVLQRNGDTYCVETAALIYCNDCYYLVGWDRAKKRLAHFRVDRMENVPEIDRKNRRQKAFTQAEQDEYVSRRLNMFGGEKCWIRMQLHDLKAIGILYDRFGDDVHVIEDRDNSWHADLYVQRSPVLWGWLCSMGDLMTLTWPEEIQKEYGAWLNNALAALHKNQ